MGADILRCDTTASVGVQAGTRLKENILKAVNLHCKPPVLSIWSIG